MRRPQEIEQEKIAMSSIVQLTGAFEGIASANIARIKTQVQSSEVFFTQLWKIYTGIRVGKEFHSGHGEEGVQIKKELIIIITSEGSLSGDIDIRLIEAMLKLYDKNKHDIISIGHHGEILLEQRHITPKESFRLPEYGTESANVKIVVQEVQKYQSTIVFYQAYLSLMHQEVNSIVLSVAVQERGESLEKSGELDNFITDVNYIFEPTVKGVVDHMERSMLGVALSEVILESKLAQQASRFQAMSAARVRAKDSEEDLLFQFNRAERSVKDERTKEIVSALMRRRLT